MANAINLTLFRSVVGLVRKAFADIPEEQMRAQPAPGINPPVWILGHIVTTISVVPKVIANVSIVPKEYLVWFGPTSKLESLPTTPPTKETLLNQLSAVYESVLTEIPKLTDEDLAKPNALKFMTQELPTQRDILENLLMTHTMIHYGQLTVWRRLMGMGPIIVFSKD
ncbi:MAG: DinB family protein [Gemmataceae bacterium]|nr:DinB family protein [Gemmataceae bacterium]